jgi:hypothetical protein
MQMEMEGSKARFPVKGTLFKHADVKARLRPRSMKSGNYNVLSKCIRRQSVLSEDGDYLCVGEVQLVALHTVQSAAATLWI